MFVAQLEAAIDAAPRHQLAHVSGLLWRAYAAGTVTEEEAQRLSDAIEVRKSAPRPTGAPGRPRAGSRPRTDASMERRRRWASAGRLPPSIACRFTLAEQAVLSVIAAQIVRLGACMLPIDAIAALAGVSRSTVKNAVREAHALGLLRVEERRLTGWRNDTNRVTITDKAWIAWLRLRAGRGGVKTVTATNTRTDQKRHSSPREAETAAGSGRPMRYGQGADWKNERGRGA